MTSKKPARKVRSGTAKPRPASAKSTPKAPVAGKTAAVQPSASRGPARQQPVKQAVLSGILKESQVQAPPPTPTAAPTPEISGEELYNRIQFQAYLLAEKDGFKADPVHYWVQAERAVKAELRQAAGA